MANAHMAKVSGGQHVAVNDKRFSGSGVFTDGHIKSLQQINDSMSLLQQSNICAR
jgi:hypothetical protein